MQRDYPRPPFPNQPQPDKAAVAGMDPPPDHGEEHYLGTGRLAGKRALITGADSGIGRAVAIAFAREGADVVIGYHLHQDDAETTADWVRKSGARAETCRADIAGPEGCKQLAEFAVQTLGGIDVLVNNAAHQAVFDDLAAIDDAE